MYLVHKISSEKFKSDELLSTTTNVFNMIVNHVYLDYIISWERFECVELLFTTLKYSLIMWLVHIISSVKCESDELIQTTTNFFNMMVNHVYLDHIISSERFESVELLRTNLKWAWIIYILSITSFNEVRNCRTTSNYFKMITKINMYISSTSSVQKSWKVTNYFE